MRLSSLLIPLTACMLHAATAAENIVVGDVVLPTPAEIDASEIINESYNFLKNREPEMTEVEFALYEEVFPMVQDFPDMAITLLETMIEGDETTSAAFYMMLANVYFSAGRLDLAEGHYKSAVSKHPEFLRAWNNLGILYYTQQRYADAIPCFSEVLRLGQTHASTYGLMGHCLNQVGNPLAAEAAFLQAFAGDPYNSDWILALLQLFIGSEQFERAETLVKQLLELKPDERDSWMLYATVLLSQDRRLEAITVMETAYRMGLTEPNDTLMLADLYADQGLFPEAMEIYSIALESVPEKSFQRMLSYLDALIGQRTLEPAAGLIERLKASVPEGRETLFLLTCARYHRARGDEEAALQAYQDVLRLDPLNGTAMVALGKHYKEQKNYARASIYFKQAFETEAQRFEASIELANLAILNRDYAEGIRYLESALLINPVPTVRNYLIRIKSLLPEENIALQTSAL